MHFFGSVGGERVPRWRPKVRGRISIAAYMWAHVTGHVLLMWLSCVLSVKTM